MDRRKEARLRSLLSGVATINRRLSTINCVVRDISATGARIEFDNAALLPHEFDLTIAARDRTYSARTMWRSADKAGISFIDPAQRGASNVIPLELAIKLKATERRNRTLQQRIDEITGERS